MVKEEQTKTLKAAITTIKMTNIDRKLYRDILSTQDVVVCITKLKELYFIL